MGEKPSFLLFGADLRSPTEESLLFSGPIEIGEMQEKLMLAVSHARKLAADSIKAAQAKYNSQYDKDN